MNSKRWFYALLSMVAVLIIALVGGAYGADMLLQKQSKQLVDQRLQSATLDDEQQGLVKANAEIKKYQQLGDLARSIVPQDKDQVQTVREIVKIAAANGITLNAISFPGSTLGGGATGSGTTTTTTTTGSAAATSSTLSQLTPVKSIPGVYDLQITLQTDDNNAVPYNQFISFLKALENNRRTALVSSISLSPSAKNSNLLSFTLILDEYIKP